MCLEEEMGSFQQAGQVRAWYAEGTAYAQTLGLKVHSTSQGWQAFLQDQSLTCPGETGEERLGEQADTGVFRVVNGMVG